MATGDNIPETDTASQSSLDSCSTITSEKESVPIFTLEQPHSNLTKKKCLRIRVQCVVKIEDKERCGLTIVSSSRTLSCLPTLRGLGNRFSVSLPIGRLLFLECWESSPLCYFKDKLSFVMSEVPAYISRHQGDLFFHFQRERVPSPQKSYSVCCTSVDVETRTHNSYVNHVLLCPNQRYHFKQGNFQVNESDERVLEYWATRTVCFRFFISDKPCRLDTQELEPHAALTKKRELLANAKKEQPRRPKLALPRRSNDVAKRGSVSLPAQLVLPGELTIYTTGIRLTKQEISQIERSGVSLNPNFVNDFTSSRALVVGDDVMRSVKLLSILPHVQRLYSHKQLQNALEKGISTLFEANSNLSVSGAPTTIEKQNNFSLAHFLAIPVKKRENFLQELVFWVHPAAEPQEKPANDLKSVIRHFGGSIVTASYITNAHILILPKLELSLLSVLHLTPAEKSVITESAYAATPDELFKSVLQQDRAILKLHSFS